MTLRTRLLIAISATIVAVLCMTQCGLYAMIRHRLYFEFDQHLNAKARTLAVLIEQHGDAIDVEFQEHQMQEFARGIRPEYYQVWRDDGTVLAKSRQLQDHNLVRLEGDMVVPVIRQVTLPDGRPGRAAGIAFLPAVEGESIQQPGFVDSGIGDDDDDDDDDDSEDIDDVDFSGRVRVTLVVAKDALDIDASLAGFAWLLTGSGCFAVIVILAVLAWLLTRSLRPLQSLARQISNINEQSLCRRFDLADAPGELRPVVARLNELMMRLEAAFMREKTFTADVAHELRTPLAGMLTTLEVGLSRHREAESYRTAMGKCLQISKETETIVATLLSLSRIEAGQVIADREPVDINSCLRKTWQPFAARAAEKNVCVDWSCDDACILTSDHDKLQVVIRNLFDNAASYVDDAGWIRITTELDVESFSISIFNTGCGLTTGQLQHVFDPFWRADSARSETGTHAGLGLALSRRIMTVLGGTIAVKVAEDRFAATLRFPATSAEATAGIDDIGPETAGHGGVRQENRHAVPESLYDC